MNNRGQLPPDLTTAIIEWAEASAGLAAVLRQIDWDQMPPEVPRPTLTLVECRPRSHARPPAWRTWLDRARGALYRDYAQAVVVLQAIVYTRPALVG